MSTLQKDLQRLKSQPKDYRWSELMSLLGRLNYEVKSGEGSRVNFYHKETNSLITLHRPHPQDILKHYAIKQVIQALQHAGFFL
jgi:predicted RNA binding protein YcfA (HicA-like mRNA interferase family)